MLFGRAEKESDDLRSAFFQEPNFYYLTGWLEPGAVLLIEPRAEGGPREILFLPKRNETQEKWTGRKVAPGDSNVRAATGFESVMPVESLEAEVKAALERVSKLYTVGDAATAALKALAPLRETGSAAKAIARLRMHKSEREIELLQRAADASIEAHRAAWKRAAPGLFEYQVAAIMTADLLRPGVRAQRLRAHRRLGSELDRPALLAQFAAHGPRGSAADGRGRGVRRLRRRHHAHDPGGREVHRAAARDLRDRAGRAEGGHRRGQAGRDDREEAPDSLYKIAYDYINTHGKDLHGEPLGKYSSTA